ncbi:hypothetical protein GCM10020000_56500 [Streptomyces olivoverticillatus]
MNSTNRTVVVTGIGATTPLGGDSASTWEGMLAGRSGVKPLEGERFAELPVRIAAPAAVDPEDVLPRPLARKLDRSAQLALIAAREAWADAGFTAKAGEDPAVAPERLGTVIASGIGGVTTLLDQYDVLREKGVRRVSPHTVPMLMPNGPSANVGLEVNAQAGVHTPVSACASGAEAIGYAVEMIRTGRADVVVAGGTEAAIHPLPIAAFANMMAMSKNNDEPEKASRPYDKARDGFVLGEGSRRRHPGVGRARRPARRAGLLRGAGPGPVRGQPPHRPARAHGPRHRHRPAEPARLQRPQGLGGRAPQRARHLHPAGRRGRDQGAAQGPGRRPGPRGGLRDEVDDRPPARRRGRH